MKKDKENGCHGFLKGKIIMGYSVEKRKCRRFEIPGGKTKFKKNGLLTIFRRFSKEYPVANLSKGRLAFISEDKFRPGDKLKIQLLVPNEAPITFRSRVLANGQPEDSAFELVGVEFMPFGNRRGWNGTESLGVLRRLDEQYGKEEDSIRDW